MTVENVSAQRKNHKATAMKALKIAAISLFALFILYEAVYIAWTNYGSSEWKLVKNEDGVKIWTMKTPGSPFVKVKGEMKAEARLASIVAQLEDTEIADKSIGIDRVDVLERKNTPGLYMAYHHYIHDLPMPIGPREFVIQVHHSQDPVTGQVNVRLLAAPNMAPPNEDVVRMTHLNNIWTLTPLGNGVVEVVAKGDMDFGGNVPYFLNNLALPEAFGAMLKAIREKANEQRFKNAEVANINDVG